MRVPSRPTKKKRQVFATPATGKTLPWSGVDGCGSIQGSQVVISTGNSGGGAGGASHDPKNWGDVVVDGKHYSPDMIKALLKERDELAAKLELCRNDLSAIREITGCGECNPADAVHELKEQNAALAATVEALRDALRDQLNDCINFDGSKLTDKIMENSTKILQMNPQQHFRDVRAEAIENALDYMYSKTNSGNDAGDDFDLIREYAERVRSGK